MASPYRVLFFSATTISSSSLPPPKGNNWISPHDGNLQMETSDTHEIKPRPRENSKLFLKDSLFSITFFVVMHSRHKFEFSWLSFMTFSGFWKPRYFLCRFFDDDDTQCIQIIKKCSKIHIRIFCVKYSIKIQFFKYLHLKIRVARFARNI